MAAKILELINKVDTFELIRDEIAAILAVETEKQQELAAEAVLDPRLWALRVFTERTNPWGEWIDAPEQLDATPIVNVWFDSAAAQMGASNVVERQRVEGVFNLDCYGYGVSEETENEYEGEVGHLPADERCAREVQRAVRLVRNIVMAGAYTYLGQRGLVGRRWIQTITAFQPAIGDRPIQRVQGMRIALHVEFNEFSPQVQGEPFELLFLQVKRKETGEVYFAAKYGDDYG